MSLKKIGSFWTAKSGKGYSGNIKPDKYTKEGIDHLLSQLAAGEEVRVLLFHNKSEHEKAPKYDLLVAIDDEPDEGGW